MGGNALGRVTFTAHRRMMSVVCDGRPKLPVGASREYSSYCGNYTYDGTRLVTPVDAASPQIRERPDRFERVVQSWDTANKATELSDFSVCTTWGVKGKDLFLLNVRRKRLEFPALKRAVREQKSLFNANVVLIEDKASGTQLIQELIVDGCHGITRYKPEGDKIMRLYAQTATIENGFVHIPEAAPWLAEYLHEMTVFPRGKHDDQVDSTAQFLDWFKMPIASWGIYETPAGARKRSSRAGNRNPPKPSGPSAAWNGLPRRTNRAERRRPLLHRSSHARCPRMARA
jgi:predicted phage terminase large subunit-like protein